MCYYVIVDKRRVTMEKQISNRTSIGNTTNPALKVIALVAAFEIPERTSVMSNGKRYANKKELTSNYTQGGGMEL